MNLLHMKYAVEVAREGSINKAAEKLFVGQPNLSRAIKELENSMNVTLFDRSTRGMILTPEGEIFIRYAKSILKQLDSIERMFDEKIISKKRFSISVPRSSYVADAFAKFSLLLDPKEEVEVFYKETNSMRAIKNILQEDYKLGIIRYAEQFDCYYKVMLDEKSFNYELITKFHYVLMMRQDSPLATKKEINYNDLKEYIEIAHADPYVPSLSFAQVKKEELPDNSRRRIYVFERCSQFELLSQNKETFMWVSPIPENLLKRYGLVQRVCDENRKTYKDVLIYQKGYSLSDLDKLFIEQLIKSKREVISENNNFKI